MKKFNKAKWDALQQRRDNLHKIYLSASDDFDYVSQECNKSISIFCGKFRTYHTALDVIRHDVHNLSADDIEANIDKMRNNWRAACVRFDLSEAFSSKHILIDLYGLMLKRRKALDVKNQAARKNQEFIACFSVLNDFADAHGQGHHSRHVAVSGNNSIY